MEHALFRLFFRLFSHLERIECAMSNLDDKITALQADVANMASVEASAVTLINGIQGQIQAAVAAALAAGATTDQLAELDALNTALVAQSGALGAAVAANTPTITPPST